ncbi:type ISP restriction/modification enzyme [Helicobacter japonicus]|uniref:type ISP restriction/modification enzyme n=1 Tax=Helicobacter japonicus TaxID=425400 RepID=UPI00339C15C6
MLLLKQWGGGHKKNTSLSSQDVNTPKLPKIIIFSTYQSIDVVIEAQKLFKSQIKLIINDEAHRTAGVQKLDSEGEKRDISVWQRTHDNALLNARFRLYLTATPRIYSPKAKEGLSKKAQGKDLMLFSMDDESLFGKEIYSLNFGKAISENLLSDFRVIISYCREEVVAEYLGKLTKAQENSKLSIESAGKMISFANALRKINMSFVDESGIHEAFKEDKEPMKRAVCFHSSIRNSKFATEQFSKISATILLDHIDGTHNAYQKAEKLSWLSEEEEGKCRVLSNAKCLTEGIDVPNLDAVCFFDKRDSIVDIVQAVGRTIRKSEGKKYGYIILPLVLTDEEIKDYNKTLKSDKFKIVWETLKALRSHDERLIDEARIAEVVSFLTDSSEIKELPEATLFTLDELFNEIKNAVPKNLGDLQYWEHYASKVGSIMHNLMLRIQTLNAQNAKIKSLFEGFCKALRGNLNVSFDTDDAIALIAQHIITKPIFECIFSNLNFATFDKVSAELEKLYKKLLNYGLGTETKELEKFYISVRSNAEYAKSDKSKQNLIKNLYDTLFKEAFKKTQEKLGIVYTPIQGVDFVIHSVAYALKKHFNKNLSDDNIHICDPFTGTGTFITRLLQSGYLDSNLESKYKNELWANEITLLGYYIAQINITTTYHDRLLKLKYLDSLSNRESSSRDIFSTAITSNSSAIAHTPEALSGRGIDKGEGATSPNSSPSPLSEKHNNNAFTLFDNLLFTDTFNTYTPDSKGFKVPFTKRQSMQLESEYFAKNLAKIQEFKNTDFKIFIANPPYSTGQKNANDNNKNTSYPFLESRIAETYVAKTKATNKGSNYDSYKMAIRYCSDRIGDNGGIIGFITNGSFIDGNSDSGLRACLEQEFDYIYIFNLRGNARTQGEFRQKEGAGFFDSGSRTPVAITLLIKCTDSAKSPDKKAQILYYDIGDYLSREQKLNIISNFKSIEGIEKQGLWQKIESNKDYDWINQRDYGFMQYLDINEIFECKSKGIQVISYDWQYNFSKTSLKETMNQTIDIYNNEANRLHCKNQEEFEIQAIKDTKQIRWNSSLYSKCFRKIKAQKSSEIIEIQIRPFSKINFFNNPIFIHRKGNEKFMPQNQKNIFIFTTNQAKNFSSLISNYIVDIEFLTKVQAFPLYYYEKIESQDTQGEQSVMDTDNNTLSEAHTIDFDDNVAYYKRKDAIRDEALAKFQEVYSTFWEQNPQFANKSSCEVYPHCDKIKSHDSATLKALSGWGIDKGEGATSPNSSPSPLSENTIISKVIKKAHCV